MKDRMLDAVTAVVVLAWLVIGGTSVWDRLARANTVVLDPGEDRELSNWSEPAGISARSEKA